MNKVFKIINKNTRITSSDASMVTLLYCWLWRFLISFSYTFTINIEPIFACRIVEIRISIAADTRMFGEILFGTSVDDYLWNISVIIN